MMISTLPHDKVIKWAKAKVHVHSDSVLSVENARAFRSELKNGKINLKTSSGPTHTVYYLESMENQLSSS